MYEKIPLTDDGQTSGQTFTSVFVPGYNALAFQFVVEAVGATPTVTFKFQGSPDGDNWYDIGYITDSTDTVNTAAKVRTGVGADIVFLSNPVARAYQHFRLVTTSVTNTTYHAEVFRIG